MRRSPRHVIDSTASRVAVMGAAAVLFLPTAALAGTDAPGAAGIGDPYFPDYGNGGYDASHYDVAVELDAEGTTLTGTTTMTARATQDLSRFDLDFVLHTTSVEVNGEPATFTHDTVHELVVTPAESIQSGGDMSVVVTYTDQPASVFDRGINPVYSTSPGMLILGEPESAAWWMATNDHPRDKATYDINITVPNGTAALSVGRLTGVDKSDAVTDTWDWQVNQPSTGYQIFLATGQYDITSSTVGGLPTLTAIGEGTGAAGAAAKADFDRLDEVEAFLSSQFGKYRFDAHGNVVPNTPVGFALECQTRPVFSPLFWNDGSSNISVVVHEQAHQWFGDNVAVHNWRDVWLNEGFASFAQWRWSEYSGGSTANQLLMAYYNGHPEGDPFWNLKIGDPGAAQLFAGEVYDRGAMTVQALRNRIGDDNLLRLFARWQKKHVHDDASIGQFRKLAQKTSGEDLKGFFTNWLYTSARPKPTEENGLGGFVADVAGTTPADIPGWDKLQQATALLSASEGATHAGG